MPQTRLFAAVPRASAGQLFAALEAAFDEDAVPIALTGADEDGPFQEISLYVEGEPEPVRQRFASLLAERDAHASVDAEILPDVDWVARSLEGLAPVRAGRFLVHGSHDRGKRQVGDIGIEIEAGMAFGTGHHGTTSGCLGMIDRVLKRRRPRRSLDLGTGSAVLAIALAKAAHVPVLATDIDPVATRIARENALLNGVGALVKPVTATGLRHPAFRRAGPFDLVVANILARPLMDLAPGMAALVSPGGDLILSGILARQRDAVIAAYVGQRFRHRQTTVRDGWVTLLLGR